MLLSTGLRFILFSATILFTAAGDSYSEGHQDKTGAAGQGIAIHALDFQNVRIQRAALDGYEFVGQIQNNSDSHTLSSVEIKITIYDCIQASGTKDCAVIGERKESIYLTIPPKQKRHFKAPIYSYGDVLNSEGDLVWDYQVLSIETAPPR